MKKSWLLPRLLLFTNLLGFVVFSGCTFFPDTDDVSTLTVIVIGPFSGDLSDLGKSMRNGIVLASEEQNARGGVLGRQIQLQLFDSACDYTTAREVTLQAIRETGANYIIGAVCGEASEGVAQVASEEGILVLNPASVNEDLTMDNDGEVRFYVYRIPYIDPVQGTAAALLAIEKLEIETASILVEESGKYESTLADAFVMAFTEGGGEIVLRESYDRNADSFYDVLAEVREANAEIIYLPGYYDVVNRISGQARAFGINQPFLGSDGWHSPEINKVFLDKSYYTSHFFVGEPRAAVLTWSAKYENRFLVLPDTVATLSYDTANILFSAIIRTGTTAPYELAASMENLEFNTVSGKLSFDELHNPIKPVTILRIENGEIDFDTRLTVNDVKE
jgi:branched-chain amino acid transport system substrate-binding protein